MMLPIHRSASLAAIAVLASLARPASAQAPVAVHLITHNEVTISRPAATIWPYIVDPVAWKKGNKLVHRDGTPGGVGELFAAVTDAHPDKADYLVQNIELTPNQRRTIKLLGTDGTLMGFASFALRATSGGTIVSYDVYGETRLPADKAKGLTAAALAEQERAGNATNGARFQQELEGLKRLVEGK